MTEQYDLVVIGAGPAGMAGAATAAECGLSVLVLDEQPEPGGQIYRAIGRNTANGGKRTELLGPDYTRGVPLAQGLAAAGVTYRPNAAVWRVDPDGCVTFTEDGQARQVQGRRLLLTTGAMERPVPIPGWTLPGVVGAGGAQVLLKSAGLVPEGRVVLAGSGPLLLLVAQQLLDAGATVAAILETVRFSDYLAAAEHLPGALRAPEYLRKGLAMRRRIRAAGVPLVTSVGALAAEGDKALARVTYRRGGRDHTIEADALLLHEGVVPNVQITRQLDCAHRWVLPQRYWEPELDEWGNTSVEGVAVAGDTGGIAGAEAAEASGRIAALDAACRLDKIDRSERDARVRPWRRALRRHRAIRPLLDRLYRPKPERLVPRDDATVVCRCEEVTAGTVREGVALGATGPNQLKAYMRCGMGPCQGRMCGLTVAEIIADARGVAVPEIGYYRIRPPIKPVTLGELAAFDE
jgi:NADPH-dependent 2,4-dienoyl-CoA reductase/sulfur reductase-like enzyme